MNCLQMDELVLLKKSQFFEMVMIFWKKNNEFVSKNNMKHLKRNKGAFFYIKNLQSNHLNFRPIFLLFPVSLCVELT